MKYKLKAKFLTGSVVMATTINSIAVPIMAENIGEVHTTNEEGVNSDELLADTNSQDEVNSDELLADTNSQDEVDSDEELLEDTSSQDEEVLDEDEVTSDELLEDTSSQDEEVLEEVLDEDEVTSDELLADTNLEEAIIPEEALSVSSDDMSSQASTISQDFDIQFDYSVEASIYKDGKVSESDLSMCNAAFAKDVDMVIYGDTAYTFFYVSAESNFGKELLQNFKIVYGGEDYAIAQYSNDPVSKMFKGTNEFMFGTIAGEESDCYTYWVSLPVQALKDMQAETITHLDASADVIPMGGSNQDFDIVLDLTGVDLSDSGDVDEDNGFEFVNGTYVAYIEDITQIDNSNNAATTGLFQHTFNDTTKLFSKSTTQTILVEDETATISIQMEKPSASGSFSYDISIDTVKYSDSENFTNAETMSLSNRKFNLEVPVTDIEKDMYFEVGYSWSGNNVIGTTILKINLSDFESMAVQEPSINVSKSFYGHNVNTSIVSSTSGATIYYTLDGSEPTTSSTEYTAPFKIGDNLDVGTVTEIRAIAVRDGYTDSPLSSKSVTKMQNVTIPEEGTYKVTIDALKDGDIADESSMKDIFQLDDLDLVVKDGVGTLHMKYDPNNVMMEGEVKTLWQGFYGEDSKLNYGNALTTIQNSDTEIAFDLVVDTFDVGDCLEMQIYYEAMGWWKHTVEVDIYIKEIDGEEVYNYPLDAGSSNGGDSDAGSGSYQALEDGNYEVPVKLWQSGKDEASMGDPAFDNTRTSYVKKEDGSVEITFYTDEMEFGTLNSEVTSITSTDDSKFEVTLVKKVGTITEFKLTTDEAYDEFDIKMDILEVGSGNKVHTDISAKLVFEWDNRITADDYVDLSAKPDGNYGTDVKLWQASKDEVSMGDPTFENCRMSYVELSDGEIQVTFTTKPMEFDSLSAGVDGISSTDGRMKNLTMTADDSGDGTNHFTFTTDRAYKEFNIKMDIGSIHTNTSAKLIFDWEDLESTYTINEPTKNSSVVNGFYIDTAVVSPNHSDLGVFAKDDTIKVVVDVDGSVLLDARSQKLVLTGTGISEMSQIVTDGDHDYEFEFTMPDADISDLKVELVDSTVRELTINAISPVTTAVNGLTASATISGGDANGKFAEGEEVTLNITVEGTYDETTVTNIKISGGSQDGSQSISQVITGTGSGSMTFDMPSVSITDLTIELVDTTGITRELEVNTPADITTAVNGLTATASISGGVNNKFAEGEDVTVSVTIAGTPESNKSQDLVLSGTGITSQTKHINSAGEQVLHFKMPSTSISDLKVELVDTTSHALEVNTPTSITTDVNGLTATASISGDTNGYFAEDEEVTVTVSVSGTPTDTDLNQTLSLISKDITNMSREVTGAGAVVFKFDMPSHSITDLHIELTPVRELEVNTPVKTAYVNGLTATTSISGGDASGKFAKGEKVTVSVDVDGTLNDTKTQKLKLTGSGITEDSQEITTTGNVLFTFNMPSNSITDLKVELVDTTTSGGDNGNNNGDDSNEIDSIVKNNGTYEVYTQLYHETDDAPSGVDSMLNDARYSKVTTINETYSIDVEVGVIERNGVTAGMTTITSEVGSISNIEYYEDGKTISKFTFTTNELVEDYMITFTVPYSETYVATHSVRLTFDWENATESSEKTTVSTTYAGMKYTMEVPYTITESGGVEFDFSEVIIKTAFDNASLMSGGILYVPSSPVMNDVRFVANVLPDLINDLISFSNGLTTVSTRSSGLNEAYIKAQMTSERVAVDVSDVLDSDGTLEVPEGVQGIETENTQVEIIDASKVTSTTFSVEAPAVESVEVSSSVTSAVVTTDASSIEIIGDEVTTVKAGGENLTELTLPENTETAEITNAADGKEFKLVVTGIALESATFDEENAVVNSVSVRFTPSSDDVDETLDFKLEVNGDSSNVEVEPDEELEVSVVIPVTIKSSTGGTIKVNGSSSSKTTVSAGNKVTLEATANSGYTFSKWVVTYKDLFNETETITIKNDSFTVHLDMESITISAEFTKSSSGNSSTGNSSSSGSSSLGSASGSSSSGSTTTTTETTTTEATTTESSTESTTTDTTTSTDVTTPEEVKDPAKTLNFEIKVDRNASDEEKEVHYAPIFEQYSDIGTHWGKNAVAFGLEQGYLYGTSEVEFGTESLVSREMMVQVLSRMTKADMSQYTLESGRFSDVSLFNDYANAVAWAIENGITNGKTDTTFEPNNNVTRQEMAMFLCRFATALDIELPELQAEVQFNDASEIWTMPEASESIRKLQQAGILEGYEGNINPTGITTKAEFATMVERFVLLLVDAQ